MSNSLKNHILVFMAIALVVNKILKDREEKMERAAQVRANAIIDEWTKKKHPHSGRYPWGPGEGMSDEDQEYIRNLQRHSGPLEKQPIVPIDEKQS